MSASTDIHKQDDENHNTVVLEGIHTVTVYHTHTHTLPHKHAQEYAQLYQLICFKLTCLR